MKGSAQPESLVSGLSGPLPLKAATFIKVARLSGGEKVKLSLAKILTGNANFIILDEPTNYLDIISMEALESVLHDYKGTMLIISHDRKFLNNVSDRAAD